jgi:hypothetical protein
VTDSIANLLHRMTSTNSVHARERTRYNAPA